MKRIFALLFVTIFCFTGCGKQTAEVVTTVEETIASTTTEETTSPTTTETTTEPQTTQSLEEKADAVQAESLNFTSLNDPELLQYVNDTLCSELENSFTNDDYKIENIDSTFISKEYLEEVAYNSQENIYFGYTLSEITEQWNDSKYIFTVDDNGQTVVQSFTDYDDTYDKAIRNVAIGAGVIISCVTVSIVTSACGLEELSLIFLSSAKNAIKYAAEFTNVGETICRIVIGYQTGNFDETLKSEILEASEGFKWGAIIGAVTGGLKEGNLLKKSAEEIGKAVTNNDSTKIGIASENYVKKLFGGRSQISYLNGEEVAYGTSGATRPDLVKTKNGKIIAYEIKNYDLINNLLPLKKSLKREVEERVENLPEGASQVIVLVTKGRGYTKAFINKIIQELQDYLFESYGGKISIISV